MTVNFRKLILSPICWFLTGRGQPNRGAVGVREASAVAGAVALAPPGTGLFLSSPAGWAPSPLPVVFQLERCHRDPSLPPSLPEPGPAARGEGSGQAARLCSQTGPCGGGARMGEKSGNENRGARLLRRARPGRGRGGCFLDHSGLRNPRRHTDLDVSSKRS